MKNNYPLARKSDIVVQNLESELLIYDLTNNKAFCLNETSAAIWFLCDGTKSFTEIAAGLSRQMGKPVDEGLIWLGIEQLNKENLIISPVHEPTDYRGMSRREAVRKIGLASLIAIPVVMSINAPVAAASASTCSSNANDACYCPGGTPSSGNCSGTNLNFFGTQYVDCTNGSPNCRCRNLAPVNVFGTRVGSCG